MVQSQAGAAAAATVVSTVLTTPMAAADSTAADGNFPSLFASQIEQAVIF